MKRLIIATVLLAAGCGPKDPPAAPSQPAAEHYEARGQEPGWHLVIQGGRIDYSGNYGEKSRSRPSRSQAELQRPALRD